MKFDIDDLICFPLDEAIQILKKQGFSIETITHTQPIKKKENYNDVRVVRLNGDQEKISLVTASFPDINK